MTVAPKVAPKAVAATAAHTAAAGAAKKKVARTAAQKKASHVSALKSAATRRKNAAAAAAAAARSRGKKNPVAPKKRAALAPGVVDHLPGWSWLMACNDREPTCAAAAVANHLLAVTGLMMTDEDILELHNMAGGNEGATIEQVLECIQSHRSAFGQARKAYLSNFIQVDSDVIVAGLVVGVKLQHAGRHAVVSTSTGMISWGRVMPFVGEPEEAWALEWIR